MVEGGGVVEMNARADSAAAKPARANWHRLAPG